MAIMSFLSLSAILCMTEAFRFATHFRRSRSTIVKVIPRNVADVAGKELRTLVGFGLAFLAYPAVGRAGLFTSTEQDAIDEISKCQKPVAELLDQLRPSNVPNAIGVYSMQQVLRGGKEDSDVVATYMETFIKPCQVKMEKVAAQLALDEEAQKRVEVLPLLMKGHILELTDAIAAQKADAQSREVDEVQETLAEFLNLASAKYTVEPYKPSRPISDTELFGPLGCEFWGKKRVEGSNACVATE